jgi:sugar lactone lactonase YvrE
MTMYSIDTDRRVVFAGPDLDTLIITAATQDMSDEQLAAAPLSAKLFSARPGVRGLFASLWNGAAAALGQR